MKYYKIDVDEAVWKILKENARPLVDTPNDVLRRLLIKTPGSKRPNNVEKDNELHEIQLGKPYDIENLDTYNLGHSKPMKIELNDQKIFVKNWTDLCINFVDYLARNGLLTENDIPIFNYSMKQKYFINSKPEHADYVKDAQWKRVGGYYIDTKYNAACHVKNIIHTTDELKVRDELKIKITFGA